MDDFLEDFQGQEFNKFAAPVDRKFLLSKKKKEILAKANLYQKLYHHLLFRFKVRLALSVKVPKSS